MNPILKYILEQALSMVPIPKLPPAIAELLPLLNQWAQSEAVLTDELRAKLQRQILKVVRRYRA